MVHRQRVAILVAARRDPFFESLKKRFHDEIEILIENFQFDLFLVEGKELPSFERRIRDYVEKIRYTKLWPILRIYDSVVFRLKKKLPDVSILSSTPRVIQISTKDDLRHLARKMYAAFQYCINEEYDFVVRTTLSSIINLNALIRILERVEENYEFYAGRELKLPGASSFSSGAFTVYNKSALQYLLDNRDKHQYGLLDDVAIGRILQGEVPFHPLKSLDLLETGQISVIPKSVVQETIHFRCKSAALPRKDIEIMSEVTEILLGAGIQYA